MIFLFASWNASPGKVCLDAHMVFLLWDSQAEFSFSFLIACNYLSGALKFIPLWFMI
jgi:hypothetical protein